MQTNTAHTSQNASANGSHGNHNARSQSRYDFRPFSPTKRDYGPSNWDKLAPISRTNTHTIQVRSGTLKNSTVSEDISLLEDFLNPSLIPTAPLNMELDDNATRIHASPYQTNQPNENTATLHTSSLVVSGYIQILMQINNKDNKESLIPWLYLLNAMMQ